MPHTEQHDIWADIKDVFADAVRVPFADVRAGDWVFDTFGGRHKLKAARVLKSGALSIKREDLPYTEHHRPDASDYPGQFTIVPQHGWDRDAVGGYRKCEGGSEFTETCRCGLVFGSGPDGDSYVAELALATHANEANGREIY